MKKDEKIDYSYWSLVKDVGGLVKPYRFKFLLGSVLRFSTDLAFLYLSYALTQMIDFFSTYKAG
jgi:tyrosyl-tRNA synthetase